jgi:hypothetical protein
MKTQLKDAANVTMAGKLEANANGEWGWLTDVVDLPIAGALADLLLGRVPS